MKNGCSSPKTFIIKLLHIFLIKYLESLDDITTEAGTVEKLDWTVGIHGTVSGCLKTVQNH